LGKLFFILCFLIGLSGCHAKKSASSEKGSKSSLSEKKDIALKHFLIKATTEKVLGNYEEAEKIYLECLKIDSKSAVTHFELSGIYLFKRAEVKAIEHAEKAVTYSPQNGWYKTNLAVIYQGSKLYEKAEVLYKELITLFPERSEYHFTLAEAYLYQGKIKDALEVYDAIEKILGPSTDLIIHKHKLYLRLGESKKAIAEIQKLIDQNPANVLYYGLLADFYENEGDGSKALAIYNKMVKIDPSNGTVHLSLYEYYRYHGNQDKALSELTLAFENSTVNIDTKMQIMLQFFTNSERNEKVKIQAYGLANILVDVHSKEAKSFSMYGDFLSRDGKLKEALQMFKKAAALDSGKFPIWSQIVFLESDLKEFELLEKDTRAALEVFPTHPTFYFFNGIANIQLKNYDKAIESLLAGKEMVFDNAQLQAEFHQYLGDAYHAKKEHAKSDESYDLSLEFNRYNPYVLNNYSYYLSLRKEKLALAETMAKEANNQVPDSPNFIDTYAWLMFLKGNYTEAETLLKKAMSLSAIPNGTILEHFGDVLFKLNKIEQAVLSWQKAKQTGGASQLIEEKILKKHYIEPTIE
jgi:tetratricopeptide (TPR) repeat protein